MPQKIIEPTLDEIVRHGNSFHQPIGRRTFLKTVGLAGASALAACSIPLATNLKRYESPNFTFSLPEDLSKEQVDYIKDEYESGSKKLEERLRAERDYGIKTGRISVETDYGATISYAYRNQGRIVLARWRLPSAVQKADQASHIHELTHLKTNSGGDFLSEGLAVYMQEQLGRNPAYPNFGAELYRQTASLNLMPLSQLVRISYDSISRLEDRERAYLQAGSFVKYLTEDVAQGNSLEEKTRHFMKFYMSGGRDYKGHFGKSFEELEQGWLGKLKKWQAVYSGDALKVEHSKPRHKPNREPLKPDRQLRVDSVLRATGGKASFIWYDSTLESNVADTIELVDFYIDDTYKGQRIGGAGPYRSIFNERAMRLYLRILGETLKGNEKRLVKDIPITFDPTWRGKRVVFHYGHKIQNISNEVMDAQVIMERI